MTPPYTKVPSLILPLQNQIEALRAYFAASAPALGLERVILFGSCARGEATYRSDVDLMLVLAEGPLTFARSSALKERVESETESSGIRSALPLQLTCVLSSIDASQDPGTRDALQFSSILFQASQEVAS